MIQYLETLNLATCRPQGILEKELARDLLHFLQAMENTRSGVFHRLLDLEGILEIRLSGADLYGIAVARRFAARNMAPCRSAIFAPSLLTYGIAKIYESLMEGSNIQVGVFSEPLGAGKWLGIPVADLRLRNGDSLDSQ